MQKGSYFVEKTPTLRLVSYQIVMNTQFVLNIPSQREKNPKSGLMQGTVFVIMFLKEVVHLVIRK